MEKTLQTKKFFMRYFKTLSAVRARREQFTEELLLQFISDPKLIEHIFFFQKAFPQGLLIPKEIIAAENKIFVRVNFKGNHSGEVDNIPPTYKDVDIPFALVYKIENEKIVEFSAIANEMDFFEQLGLSKEQVEVPMK